MKLRVISRLLIAMVFVACARGERQQTTSNDKPLTIKGSDTMVILGQRLAEEYMKANPGAVVQVNGGGSGTGIAALLNRTVDLAQSSRPMKEEEKTKAKAQYDADVVEHPIALDALAVFVHSSNTVQSLSIAQMKDIFQGKVTNWAQVGGANAPIILYG
ncbi:MAG TPA: substrate-binding domain-containing protein, partial [Thermoanaerobaculia bacterium]